MPIADVIGLATLIGILLTASLVVYLINVAKRITSEMRDSRTLTSTSVQTVAENHSRELKQISETLSTTVRDSGHEMKNEIAKLSISIELPQSTLISALKSQGCELRDLANALHESTISRLSQHEISVVSALRESYGEQQADAGTATERLVVEASMESLTGDLRRELGQMSDGLLVAVDSSSHKLMDELAKLANSIELAQSTLGAALESQGCELRDLASALHESTVSRLSQHESGVVSALRESPDVRQVDADVPAEAVATEANLVELRAATADEGVALAAPLGEAAAVVDSAAGHSAAEIGSLEEANRAEAPDYGTVSPAIRVYSWEDLPERVRARWMPRISQMILPPVSYYSLHEDASPKELVARAKNDPVLCAKILAVANSAAQGQINPVTSIERAAVQLGANLLQIIISAYHLEAIFGRYSGYSKEHFKFVQKWSCESSVLAYHIALEAGSADYAMLSTAALITRLGSLLLGMVDIGPDEKYRYILSETDRCAFEMERWKVCTPLLSEQMALHWELPEPLPILLRLQEKPMFQELTSSPEDRNLLIICLSSVLASAFISQGGENLLQVLSDLHYAVLKRNMETRGLQQAVSDAWASKALQREFMTIVEMIV